MKCESSKSKQDFPIKFESHYFVLNSNLLDLKMSAVGRYL